MSRRLDGSQMRPVSDISGLRERLLPKAVAVSVQRGMGRHVLQPGPELLYQPRAVQERRHVLQHGPGPLHVLVSARLLRARVQRRPGPDRSTGTGLFHGTRVPERRYVQGECHDCSMSYVTFIVVGWCTISPLRIRFRFRYFLSNRFVVRF